MKRELGGGPQETASRSFGHGSLIEVDKIKINHRSLVLETYLVSSATCVLSKGTARSEDKLLVRALRLYR